MLSKTYHIAPKYCHVCHSLGPKTKINDVFKLYSQILNRLVNLIKYSRDVKLNISPEYLLAHVM